MDDTTFTELLTKFNLTKLPTDEMELVFTAQSKLNFYLRDDICQYVLDQKLLPINSYRIFDYLFSNRVPKDIIQRSNNHLLKICSQLWVFGSISDGVLFEIIYAKKLNIPIRYFAISSLSPLTPLITEIEPDKVILEILLPIPKYDELITLLKT